jgi:hypothetical protein
LWYDQTHADDGSCEAAELLLGLCAYVLSVALHTVWEADVRRRLAKQCVLPHSTNADYLNELTYPAELAGLSYSFSSHLAGFQVSEQLLFWGPAFAGC